MPRFILIDHSVIDLAGHHYEYAHRVLEAAQVRGYECILATNRRWKTDLDLPWKTHAVYRLGFWEDRPRSLLRRILSPLLTWLRRRKARLRVSFIYSTVAFLWAMRQSPRPYWDSPSYEDTGLGKRLLLASFAYIHRVAVAAQSLLSATRAFYRAIPGHRLFISILTSTLFKTALRVPVAFGRTLRALLGPLVILLFRSTSHLRSKERPRIVSFYRDSRKLFARVGFRGGDIVFLPTISEHELLALARLLRKYPKSRSARWHLLFRRNIYTGRPEKYDAQDGDQVYRRAAFASFQAQAPSHDVFFYTDTDELTRQYNRLSRVRFATLPIPHTNPARPWKMGDNRLRISYLGDARTEKGYHYLPGIVSDLSSDPEFKDRVVFSMQSNFNVPGGEPAPSVARSELGACDHVQLFDEPLLSEEFEDLIHASDIVLLPYDPENYFARSSGILTEALAAGIPCIVPAATWMSRQFSTVAYRQLCAQLESLPSGEVLWVAPLAWRQHGARPAVRTTAMEVGRKGSPTYTWLSIPPGARYLCLRFRCAGDTSGDDFLVFTEQLGARGKSLLKWRVVAEASDNHETMTVLVPLDPITRRMWIGLSNPFSDRIVSLRDVQASFVTKVAEPGLPLGAISLTYSQPDEISQWLREMLRFYSHYRTTAQHFAKEYYAFHNPGSLLDLLAGQVRQRAGTSERRAA